MQFVLTLDQYCEEYYEWFHDKWSKVPDGSIAKDLYYNGQFDDEPYCMWRDMFGESLYPPGEDKVSFEVS